MNNEIDIILEHLKDDAENKQLIEESRVRLEEVINHLINTDFERLTGILYRIDVSEAKLKALLKETQGKNSASLIAQMIIERQLQKIKSRREFSQRNNPTNADENEKW